MIAAQKHRGDMQHSAPLSDARLMLAAAAFCSQDKIVFTLTWIPSKVALYWQQEGVPKYLLQAKGKTKRLDEANLAYTSSEA